MCIHSRKSRRVDIDAELLLQNIAFVISGTSDLYSIMILFEHIWMLLSSTHIYRPEYDVKLLPPGISFRVLHHELAGRNFVGGTASESLIGKNTPIWSRHGINQIFLLSLSFLSSTVQMTISARQGKSTITREN